MSTLSFRYRKSESEINCGFSTMNGQNYTNVNQLAIGDTVSLFFETSHDLCEAFQARIETNPGVQFMPQAVIPGDRPKLANVMIEFEVVKRNHFYSWKEIGLMRELGLSVVLEAKTGIAEDVFLWVCLQETPSWAKEVSE